jgi:lipopolysaccharide export system protein LptA
VSADVLSAHYRESATGKREIWRLEANGDVIIDRNGERAFSEHVVYEVDDNKVTLTGGRPNRLVSDEGEVSAEEQIEYWAEERKLVARGNAVAQEEERQVQASVITAYLRETQGGAIGLQRVDATGGVRLVTQNDVVRAEQGSYDAVRRVATVSGSVRITRGGNQLNGCRGEVDLNTGINRLLPCADNTGTGTRVHGLIDPEAARQRTQAR